MVDVFISYPRVERANVEPIRDKLEALGLDTFFDIHGIDGGDTFPDVIDQALRSAKAVLGIWSPLAFQSKWCMIECRFAAARGVLVPIALERFDELAMKSDFMTTNYLDLTDFDGRDDHAGWQRTLRSLSRHVGRELGGAAAVSLQGPTLSSPALPKGAPRFVPEMVRIPPGRFLMGSPTATERRWTDYDGREEPQHEVRIDYPFELGKFEVTVDEFATFVSDAKHDMGHSAFIWDGEAYKDSLGKGWRDPGFEQTGTHPVCCVSRIDAKAYVAWLNIKLGLDRRQDAYRLPSEAEWEYCCRAGTTTAFSFGATISTAQANYDGNSAYGAGKKGECRKKTTPVGSFPANAFGLHDMHGNVGEWCDDAWNANYNGAPNDGSAWLTGDTALRVVRGGSWNDEAEDLRSASRTRVSPANRGHALGFRLARTVRES